jgi:hypothetical protein
MHRLGVHHSSDKLRRASIVSIAALCALGVSCSSGGTPPAEAPAAETTETTAAPSSNEPAGTPITGDAIASWFEGRGGKMPGAIKPTETECRTVSAPVPSGQALWCEQRSAIEPWVQMTRTVLYDVRGDKTLLLVNLLSRVAAGDAAPGSGCQGALVALKIELGEGAKTLTVAEDSACACAGVADGLASRAASAKDAGKMSEAQKLEQQSQQVKQACAQLGTYAWEEHGYMPAD